MSTDWSSRILGRHHRTYAPEAMLAEAVEHDRMVRTLQAEVLIAAGGEGWRHQLRDRMGRWIEMGGIAEWTERGRRLIGEIEGIDNDHVLVRAAADDRVRRVRASMITMVSGADQTPDVPDAPREARAKIRRTKGKSRRITQPLTSLADYSLDVQKMINDAGTDDDPAHSYTWKKKGLTLTVRQSDVAQHIVDVVRAAVEEGRALHPLTDPAKLVKAQNWYRDAHRICIDMARDVNEEAAARFVGMDVAQFRKEHPQPGVVDRILQQNGQRPLTVEVTAGVVAAMSPRMGWSENLIAARKVLATHMSGYIDGIDIDEAKYLTAAGLTDYVALSLRILREPDPDKMGTIMTGLKRQSFWNNLIDPENPTDVTVDGWMTAALWRMGGTFDGTDIPVNDSALAWLDHSKERNKQVVMPGGGYVIMADAIRAAAAELGLLPSEAQAIYWVSVGGGEKNTQMWSYAKKAPKEARKKTTQRKKVAAA